jgi:adenine-specific DNA-methyltransferase
VTFIGPDAQNFGEVFTRRWVVEVLLDLVGYTTDRDLGSLELVEPSCGSGAFLGPVVERLIESAKAHGHDLLSLSDSIRAYDLQAEHVEACRTLCRRLLVDAGVAVSTATELAEGWVCRADFLLPHSDGTTADVVAGNPPYIRYDDLPDELASRYRSTWPTMRGRGDIYVGFIERSLRLLKPGGKVGFICADRWMRNQYGAELRELVARDYAVEHVWTMHDVDAFEEQVAAYPVIKRASPEPTSPTASSSVIFSHPPGYATHHASRYRTSQDTDASSGTAAPHLKAASIAACSMRSAFPTIPPCSLPKVTRPTVSRLPLYTREAAEAKGMIAVR